MRFAIKDRHISMNFVLIAFIAVFLAAFSEGAIAAPPVKSPPPVWPPAEGVPMTEWGKQVSADHPVLPEYPRPQLVRHRWLNLNGLWDYAITSEKNSAPTAYDGKILVPFPVESVLSQVNKRVDEASRLWYRRTIEIPADWSGQRVLLHFGAIDWEATITLNGKTFPTHRGGYDGFTIDITDAPKARGEPGIDRECLGSDRRRPAARKTNAPSAGDFLHPNHRHLANRLA